MKKENRDFKIEFRIKRDDGQPVIEGYAAVFNSNSEFMGFTERIASGAFKKALKVSDARALFNHNPDYVLGRQSAGTLELREDNKGLFMSVKPPDTQFARDLMTSIERGDINQQSFGFTVGADSWKDLDTDNPKRTIDAVDEIFDVSPVTYPAYKDTEVALRSLEGLKSLERARAQGEPQLDLEANAGAAPQRKKASDVLKRAIGFITKLDKGV